MDEVVVCRPARSLPLAAADLALGHPLCPRTAHRGQLAAGGGDWSRLQRLLLLHLRRGTQVQIGGHATLLAALAEVAPGRSAVVGPRRHSHQALRPEGPGRGHPSQSHAGTGRREVSLRPHLGNAVVGRAASAVGHDRPAPVGRALCSTQEHLRHPQATRLGVPNEVAAGGGLGGLGRGDRLFRGKTAVGRRRRRLRQAARSSNRC